MMSPTEYGKVAEWFAEGRLQVHRMNGTVWNNWDSQHLPNIQSDWKFSEFRRRPEEPTLPAEVWVSSVKINVSGLRYASDERPATLLGGECVRYVRADSVICGSRLEFRNGGGPWLIATGEEYRFRQ